VNRTSVKNLLFLAVCWLCLHPVAATPGPDSLFLAAKQRYKLAADRNDEHQAARALQEMGRICFHSGQYPQSLDYYSQAARLFRKLGETARLAESYNNLGQLHYYNRQPALARQHYRQALALYQSIRDADGLAATYGNLGHFFEKQQRYDSAFYFQHLALRQYQRRGNNLGVSKISENLGSIFEDLGKYDSSRHYFEQALRYSLLTRDSLGRIEILNNLGDVLRKTGRYREGLVFSRKALDLAVRTNERHQLSGAYNDIAKGYNLLGQNDSAFHYLALSREYQAAIYSEESGQQMALLQSLYDLEKKNAEIDRLTLARRNSQLLIISSGIVVALLIGLGALAYSRQRLKIRNERKLHDQNQAIYQTRHELVQAELKNRELEEANLKQALEIKNRELSTHILQIVQKNKALEELKTRLEGLIKDDKRDQRKQIKKLVQQINESFTNDRNWEDFNAVFEHVHQSFFDKLKAHSDQLTSHDIRLISLMKMNLPSTEVATLLGISPDSLRVTRYRLRKKLGLKQGENLTAFIQAL
jgi:tetratricopeptide (TPR) repeat protein